MRREVLKKKIRPIGDNIQIILFTNKIIEKTLVKGERENYEERRLQKYAIVLIKFESVCKKNLKIFH